MRDTSGITGVGFVVIGEGPNGTLDPDCDGIWWVWVQWSGVSGWFDQQLTVMWVEHTYPPGVWHLLCRWCTTSEYSDREPLTELSC